MSTGLTVIVGACFVVGITLWVVAAVTKVRHDRKSPQLMFWGAMALVLGSVAMTIYFTSLN